MTLSKLAIEMETLRYLPLESNSLYNHDNENRYHLLEISPTSTWQSQILSPLLNVGDLYLILLL